MERPTHDNNFGVLRLLFAALVVLSHVPEQIDGDRHREILLSLFHTISLGDLAVDLFFLVSGYLITQSWVSGHRPIDFIWRRILRIYPAFIVSSILGLFVLAPLAGTGFSGLNWRSLINDAARLLGLCPIDAPVGLSRVPSTPMNPSVWTLRYEFRCYLLVAILGSFGQRFRPRVIALAALVLLAGAMMPPIREVPPVLTALLGWPHETMRLTAMFAAGATYFLGRDTIPLSRVAAVASVIIATVALATPFAEMGIAIFGGYSVFWFATEFRSSFVAKINNRIDLSYGVYLYSWPIATTLLHFSPHISIFPLYAETLTASLMIAVSSWYLVEKPALGMKRFSPALLLSGRIKYI